MQPNQQYSPYGQQAPLGPNPYAQQVPIAPVKLQGSRPIGLIISLVLTVLMLFGAIGFGFWAYASRADYKNNSDKKVAAAVTVAKQQEASAKDAEFVEKEKNPAKLYQGPATYGSLSFQYPKTWSGYVVENGSGSRPLDAYFHPNIVPGVTSGTNFALHVEVTTQSYANELKALDGFLKTNKVTAKAYALPKLPSVNGTRFDGTLANGIDKGTMIVMPLRDKTIKISTQAEQFRGDLEEFVLATFNFEP